MNAGSGKQEKKVQRSKFIACRIVFLRCFEEKIIKDIKQPSSPQGKHLVKIFFEAELYRDPKKLSRYGQC